MESAQAPLRRAYGQGYLDGYNLAIKVVDACVAQRSHANPTVARLLNDAFSVLSQELKTSRALIQGMLDANPSQSQEQ